MLIGNVLKNTAYDTKTPYTKSGILSVWKSKFYGAFSTPSTRRLLDGVHPTHWLISTQVLALCIDLEERLRHDAALYKRRPTPDAHDKAAGHGSPAHTGKQLHGGGLEVAIRAVPGAAAVSTG